MATRDGNDRTDASNGDWWTQHAPPAASGPTFDQVNADYQKYLGRPLSQAEYDQNWKNATGYNSSMIANSPEGLALANKNVPGTPTYDPSVAVAAGNQTGQTTTKVPDPSTPPPGGNNNPSTTGVPTLGVPTSGFGATPTPYASDPNAPTFTPLPDYQVPTWTGGDFTNPTVQDLENAPGYQARLDQLLKGKERAYAAGGTLLNGGTLRALDQAGQDYATNEYQTLRNNALDAYKLRYSQFTDAAGMSLAARTEAANENQNTFANRLNLYTGGNARTLSDYVTNINTLRNSETDYWNRLMDVNGTGSSLAGGSR